jgi:histidinol dehydrogenase
VPLVMRPRVPYSGDISATGVRREETRVTKKELDVRLEAIDPDANTAIIDDARVAQAVHDAQEEYRQRQKKNAAHPGPENLIILRVHSW